MIIGEVVGSLWSTRKDERLNGLKFLVIKPKYSEGLASSLVAADSANAGVGDTVLVTKGSSAKTAFGIERIPIDAVIVGVIDSIDIIDEYIR